MESQMIKHMIEDHCADNGIPLPNVSSKILSKVTKYCKKHVDASFNSSAMKNMMHLRRRANFSIDRQPPTRGDKRNSGAP